jgi:uncharacterized protein YkwD
MRSFVLCRALSVGIVRFVSRCGRARLAVAFAVAGCSTALQMPTPSPQPTTTAANRDYARIESELFDALNRARTDPQGTAIELDALTKYYNGNLFQLPGQPVPLRTVEGIAAVREAASAVRSERPLGELTLSPDLTRAARDHALDQRRTGEIGHTGSDGSSVDTRVRRYGTWLTSLSENIDYSPAGHGGDVVQSLLIDDGVADRGHRRNVYGPMAKVVGIACEPHPRYGSVCVIVQTGGFTPR